MAAHQCGYIARADAPGRAGNTFFTGFHLMKPAEKLLSTPSQVSPNTTELVSFDGKAGGELIPLEPPRLDHCSIQVDCLVQIVPRPFREASAHQIGRLFFQTGVGSFSIQKFICRVFLGVFLGEWSSKKPNEISHCNICPHHKNIRVYPFCQGNQNPGPKIKNQVKNNKLTKLGRCDR